MIDGVRDPEWRLAAEVLRQALEDAQSQSGRDGLNLWDVQEAQRFCLDTTGVWAEAQADWCLAAGVEPEAFHARARSLIKRHMA